MSAQASTHLTEALMTWSDLCFTLLTGLLEQLPSAVVMAAVAAVIACRRRQKPSAEGQREAANSNTERAG
ncbi:hypothetical protein ACIGFK_41130 [Streptomyces sp. NPDC085524]|uniref:hypothetical protein n=1 Tax=Streptomyces sp. NPDC085524 TaxID=3365728 RepID=UPI0037D32BE6